MNGSISNKRLVLFAIAGLAICVTLLIIGRGDRSDAAADQVASPSFSILKTVSDGKERIDQTMRMLVAQSLSMAGDSSSSGGDSAGFPIHAMGETRTQSGAKVVVLRSDDSFCIFTQSEGGTCGSQDLAASGLYSSTSGSCAGETVTGLVPDGIDELLVEREGEQVGSVSVTSNVFRETFPPMATTLRAENSDFEIRLPLASFSKVSSVCE